MTCEAKNTTQCSSNDPHYFRVTKRWASAPGAIPQVRTECLAHAMQSETRGQAVELILT